MLLQVQLEVQAVLQGSSGISGIAGTSGISATSVVQQVHQVHQVLLEVDGTSGFIRCYKWYFRE